MKKFIQQILEDGEGGLSSTRLVAVVWGIGVFVVWAILSFMTSTLLPMPESILICVLAGLGIKVAQRIFGEGGKNGENKSP